MMVLPSLLHFFSLCPEAPSTVAPVPEGWEPGVGGGVGDGGSLIRTLSRGPVFPPQSHSPWRSSAVEGGREIWDFGPLGC